MSDKERGPPPVGPAICEFCDDPDAAVTWAMDPDAWEWTVTPDDDDWCWICAACFYERY